MGCAMSEIIFEFLEFNAKPLRDVSNDNARDSARCLQRNLFKTTN